MNWIDNRINDSLLTEENHEMDNSFLRFDFLNTADQWRNYLERQYGMALIGYSPDDEDYVKIVFEDRNFEKHWVHFDKQRFDSLKNSGGRRMKTEQEVREAITTGITRIEIEEDKIIRVPLLSRSEVQDLAVIIGKALGVVE